MASRRLMTTISRRQATIFVISPSSFPKSHFVQPLKALIPFPHFHPSTFRTFSSKPSKFAIKPALTAFEGGTYDFGDDDEEDDGDSSGAADDDDDDDDVDGSAGRRSVLEPERIEERSYYNQTLLRVADDIGYKVIGPLKPQDRVFKSYQPVFAVVQIGAHQFKVSNGDAIYVERLKYCEVNDKLLLSKVMMLGSPTQTIIGRPVLPEAAVHAVVEEHALDAKVIIFKKKRRKNYRRTKGHRQELTRLRITNIQGLEKSKAPVRRKTVKSSAKKVEKKAVPAQIES